ncbi:IS3 family transposase [Testudinibacter aquarius]|uniref:Putative transposase n=1 Tax=Testudinibacter aquarius TaxID=1524974 RepID=A0A4R3XYD8_9PAST|nr:IS3 family transposase [Testudinibacter aquarius]KAE9526399.1 hypothetical protein A1D24_12505 [Testudinibacter aquarius]TCV82683.1 putative transposase [Testudinibacter aquarius]
MSKEGYSHVQLTRCFSINRSTLYRWLKAPTTALSTLEKRILQLHEESEFTYGVNRMMHALRLEGIPIGRAKVRKKMRALKLKPHYPKPVFYRKSLSHYAENTLNQVFYTKDINTIWVGDISYIYTQQGWLYLAVVLDLFSRKVVGWACSKTIDTDLTEKALRLAVHRRKPQKGLLFHSDRGSQYTSKQYRDCLSEFHMVASQSRAGKCTDNAVTERFFRSLKCERVHRQNYRTFDEALLNIADYIERYYNHQRLHSTLGYLSPVMFERQKANTKMLFN